MELGWLLYIILAVLLFFCFPHFRGKSMEDLFDDSEELHHQVHGVGKHHPKGGTWSEHNAWLADEITARAAKAG